LVLLAALLAACACGERSPAPARDERPWAGGDAAAVREVLPENARAVVEDADEVWLYALDPRPVPEDQRAALADAETFGDERVLGKARLTDPAERRRLGEGLYRALIADGPAAACFIPRHGARFVKGDAWVEFVVCFECNQMHVTASGSEKRGGSASRVAEPALDALLKAHGLPKAPP
jgi:hypothetical protein